MKISFELTFPNKDQLEKAGSIIHLHCLAQSLTNFPLQWEFVLNNANSSATPEVRYKIRDGKGRANEISTLMRNIRCEIEDEVNQAVQVVSK